MEKLSRPPPISSVSELRIFLRAFGGALGLILGVGLGLFVLWEIGDLLWGWSESAPYYPKSPWDMLHTLARLLGSR